MQTVTKPINVCLKNLLNNILKGSRNINVNIAIALESAGFKTANHWLTKQMEYNLELAQKDEEVIKKKMSIKIWNEMEQIVPLTYFKKQSKKINSSDDIKEIFEIYNVQDFNGLKNKIENFSPIYFRKSSKFVENKNNVLAWSLFAEYLLKNETIKEFSRETEINLIKELNNCFYKNESVIDNSKKILNKYGIKFIILDRPSQTPVDGKSFMSGDNVLLSTLYIAFLVRVNACFN